MPVSLLPSEIARLVLNYLDEENLKDTFTSFLNECNYLAESKNLIEDGYILPKTIHGKTLKEHLTFNSTSLNDSTSEVSVDSKYSPKSTATESVGIQTEISFGKSSAFEPTVEIHTPISSPGTKSISLNMPYQNKYNTPEPYQPCDSNHSFCSYESDAKRQRLSWMDRKSVDNYSYVNPSNQNVFIPQYQLPIQHLGKNFIDYNNMTNRFSCFSNQIIENYKEASPHPCKCGSLEHRRITHKGCPLNPREILIKTDPEDEAP